MVRMVNQQGQEFSCEEDIARGFEARGVARRLKKGSTPAARAESFDEHYTTISEFVAGCRQSAALFAHLEEAVIQNATAAGDRHSAEAIIQAGAVARAGGHQVKPTGVAAQIIAAGKKARGER